MCVKLLENFAKDKFRSVNYTLKLETSLKSIETTNEQHHGTQSIAYFNCV
jgi:hypothetical protein